MKKHITLEQAYEMYSDRISSNAPLYKICSYLSREVKESICMDETYPMKKITFEMTHMKMLEILGDDLISIVNDPRIVQDHVFVWIDHYKQSFTSKELTDALYEAVKARVGKQMENIISCDLN